jgi:hypothetical protein
MSGSLPPGFTLDPAPPAATPGLPAGYTLDQPTQPGVLDTLGHKVGLGVRNVAEGTVGPLYDLAAKPFQWAGLPVHSFSDNLTALGLPQPQTPFERGASAVIEPVAGVMTGLGAGRVLSAAASPVVSAIGDALQAQPVTQAVSAGAGGATTAATGSPLAGALVSMATPLAGVAGGQVVRPLERLAFGGSITPDDAALARTANVKYDIPINTGDMTDNSILRNTLDQAGKLPFSGARPAADAKQTAWQGAIAREMGDPNGATAFTPSVMDASRTRIGQAFNDVAAHTSIPPAETATLGSDLDAIIPDASKVLTEGELVPLQKQIDGIKKLAADNGGTISGDAYQALTRVKAPLDLLESSTDPNKAHFAGLVRDALDDAFMRSAAPADQDALGQAKYQYRVMRTVDQLAAGSRDGSITGDGFMQKVLTASRRFDSPTGGMAYTGGGNIGELARIGKLMRAAPQTGTADRALVNAAAFSGLAGLGSITPTGALYTAGTLAANRAAGSYLRSGSLANRLIEGAIGAPPGQQNPLLQALQTSGVTGLNSMYRNGLAPPTQ